MISIRDRLTVISHIILCITKSMSGKIYKARYKILFIIYLFGENISYHFQSYYTHDILYEIFIIAAFHKKSDIANTYDI